MSSEPPTSFWVARSGHIVYNFGLSIQIHEWRSVLLELVANMAFLIVFPECCWICSCIAPFEHIFLGNVSDGSKQMIEFCFQMQTGMLRLSQSQVVGRVSWKITAVNSPAVNCLYQIKNPRRQRSWAIAPWVVLETIIFIPYKQFLTDLVSAFSGEV